MDPCTLPPPPSNRCKPLLELPPKTIYPTPLPQPPLQIKNLSASL
jgi:hypothetical protein